jgi:hypothetical protein
MKRPALLLAIIVFPSGLRAQAVPEPSPVRVVVDPRIELMSVVQLLSGYFLITHHDFQYRQEAVAYFAPYEEHAAVRLFGEMSQRGFAGSVVPEAMVVLTAPPVLAERAPFSTQAIRGAGGEEALRAWIAALRDFAVVSDFERFFLEHQDTYAVGVNSTRGKVRTAVDAIGQYTGVPITSGTVVLGPLLHDGGFSASYENGPDSLEVFAFMGPSESRDGLPDFGEVARVGDLVAHELSHTIVNPLTRQHSAQVEGSEHLLDTIAEAMRRNGYSAWETVVNEHVIRAITTRLVFRLRGEEAGRQELARELQRGFIHIPSLIERLEEYEQSPEQFPTIAEFYPRLLNVFTEALRSEAVVVPPAV